jgi:ubiquinone/menaquinone biosynthesis C-methylase UbiE
MTSADEERVAANVAQWTKTNREFTDADAERQWRDPQIYWGEFDVRDEWLGDVAGLDVVELGAGTAYFSAKLARAGARPVAVDPTPAQLDTARAMQAEFGLEFPLVEAVAEDVPLPDESFDLAISEYGASIWADPCRWIPEAARMLRPGGRLVFLRNSTISMLCMREDGITESLQRPQRGLCRMEWADTGEVAFQLPLGELFALLRSSGFDVERIVELYAPDDATTHDYYPDVTAEWAQRWPSEEMWAARKR